MADVDITTNTLVSALTPSGGDAADHYFVSNSATLTVDVNFIFKQLTLGSNIALVKSAGTLAVNSVAGSVTIDSNEPTLTSKEVFSIRMFGLGVVEEGSPPPDRDTPPIFKCVSNFPHMIISIQESGAKWNLDPYYVLEQPLPWFEVYEDLVSGEGGLGIGNRMDITMFSENEGGTQFDLQDRWQKRPRYFHKGQSGRTVSMKMSFDMNAPLEAGMWQQLKRLKENDTEGALISDRRVWLHMKITNVTPITRKASSGPRSNSGADFTEAL